MNRNSAIQALIIALILVICRASEAAPASKEPTQVYRCPGPPVRYTDEITSTQALELKCRHIEGAPITIQPNGSSRLGAGTRPTSKLTIEQQNTCAFFADTGSDMVGRQARGWTKQEQIAHYRKVFGDSDFMREVNRTLNYVYGNIPEGSSQQEYRNTFYNICASKFHTPGKK